MTLPQVLIDLLYGEGNSMGRLKTLEGLLYGVDPAAPATPAATPIGDGFVVWWGAGQTEELPEGALPATSAVSTNGIKGWSTNAPKRTKFGGIAATVTNINAESDADFSSDDVPDSVIELPAGEYSFFGVFYGNQKNNFNVHLRLEGLQAGTDDIIRIGETSLQADFISDEVNDVHSVYEINRPHFVIDSATKFYLRLAGFGRAQNRLIGFMQITKIPDQLELPTPKPTPRTLIATMPVAAGDYVGYVSPEYENNFLSPWTIAMGITGFTLTDIPISTSYGVDTAITDAVLIAPALRITDTQTGWLFVLKNGDVKVGEVVFPFSGQLTTPTLTATDKADLRISVWDIPIRLIPTLTSAAFAFAPAQAFTVDANDDYSIEIHIN